MEIIRKVSFKDLMIILNSIGYFDFKDNDVILSDTLYLCKHLIIFYEDEITIEDLLNISKIYFKETS